MMLVIGIFDAKATAGGGFFYAWLLVNLVIGTVSFFVKVAVGFQRVAVPFVVGVGDIHQAAGFALAD